MRSVIISLMNDIMLSDVMLSVIMLSVIMLSNIMPDVIMLNVICWMSRWALLCWLSLCKMSICKVLWHHPQPHTSYRYKNPFNSLFRFCKCNLWREGQYYKTFFAMRKNNPFEVISVPWFFPAVNLAKLFPTPLLLGIYTLGHSALISFFHDSLLLTSKVWSLLS